MTDTANGLLGFYLQHILIFKVEKPKKSKVHFVRSLDIGEVLYLDFMGC